MSTVANQRGYILCDRWPFRFWRPRGRGRRRLQEIRIPAYSVVRKSTYAMKYSTSRSTNGYKNISWSLAMVPICRQIYSTVPTRRHHCFAPNNTHGYPPIHTPAQTASQPRSTTCHKPRTACRTNPPGSIEHLWSNLPHRAGNPVFPPSAI